MKHSSLHLILLSLLLWSCKADNKQGVQAEEGASKETTILANVLTEQEKSEGWTLLFDGKSLDGWHLYNNPGVESIWKVEDGVLICDPLNGNGAHGDLVTDRAYENYELTFEWDLPDTGNSGIFINVQEEPEFLKTYNTGPEYQLLGEKHLDYELDVKRSGCLYAYAPRINEARTKPQGAWNRSRIIQRNGKAEFYLNGQLTAKVDFTSPEWQEWLATSGFQDNPEFGRNTKGQIGLQLWTSAVRFRNIKIREL